MIKSDHAVIVDLFGVLLRVAIQKGNKPRLYVELPCGMSHTSKEVVVLDNRRFFDAIDLSLAVSDKVHLFSKKEKEALQYILDNQTTFRTINT